MLRRLGVMFLLACVVSISTAGCLLVPVPVGGGYHHHRGRWWLRSLATARNTRSLPILGRLRARSGLAPLEVARPT
jgi:hypothetical protein